uniref:Uncharacterized protein n=1 Tax=Tanacetum cinerariifolium TaxID=118510 RepID=A0A699H312_TANCI|nr:hypothetical protein [Tanacetum cinerariifolium]
MEDSDSVSKDAEDEGPTVHDEDPAAGDEGLAVGDEGPGQSSRSITESERPKRVSALRHPILTTKIDPKDGIFYINVPTYPPLAPPTQTPPSPEWSSGSLPISPAPFILLLPISSHMIPLTVPSLVASPATVEIEVFLTELGARVEMQGGLIRNHTIAKERRAWLDLAEIVDSKRRGQEPRGDV